MEKGKKIDFKQYFKENYKIFIPIALMVVLFAAFFVYYKMSLTNSYREEVKGNFYQYFGGKKYEYEGVVSKNKKGVVVDFQEIDMDISQDSTPIYYSDGNTVIFPDDMSVVMPLFNCSEYLAKKYSYIEYGDRTYKLTTDKYSDNLGHYFLYDGDDLYFFIEEVTLIVNSEEVILSPFSYISAGYNDFISYYDKKSDVYRTITVKDTNTIVKNDYYSVYISKDIIDYYGTDVILTSDISMLNTIDMKG